MRRLHAGSKDLGLDTVFIFSLSYSIRVYAFILKVPVMSMTFRGTFLVAKDTSNHSDHLHSTPPACHMQMIFLVLLLVIHPIVFLL